VKFNRFNSQRECRKGTAYVAILAMSIIVGGIGAASIWAARSNFHRAETQGDGAQARSMARSAIEIARVWINQDPNWRTNRPDGVWASNLSLKNGNATIEVRDASGGKIADDPHSSIYITATVKKGIAKHRTRVTLAAAPIPLPALKYPLHTAGLLHVQSSDTLYVGAASVSTNGNLRVDGTLVGNAEALLSVGLGKVTGTTTIAAAAKALPTSDVPEKYAALGTLISPGSSIDKQVLGPGCNPYGAPNANGVYVIRSSNDITLTNTRIYGTLIIINPGKTVTIGGQVNITPIRTDFPTLIINGNCVMQFTSSGTPLSEAAQGVNYNPPGAPYGGISDADKLGAYPSEIRGLIHVTGTLTLAKDGVIRGGILCEAAPLLSDAVVIQDDREIFYDSRLFSSPPRWYTTSVPMKVVSGSWIQITD
jgi:hypothetical protein